MPWSLSWQHWLQTTRRREQVVCLHLGVLSPKRQLSNAPLQFSSCPKPGHGQQPRRSKQSAPIAASYHLEGETCRSELFLLLILLPQFVTVPLSVGNVHRNYLTGMVPTGRVTPSCLVLSDGFVWRLPLATTWLLLSVSDSVLWAHMGSLPSPALNGQIHMEVNNRVALTCLLCVCFFKNSLKIKLFFSYKEGQDWTSFSKHVKTLFTTASLGVAVVRWSQSANKRRRRNPAVTLVRCVFS